MMVAVRGHDGPVPSKFSQVPLEGLVRIASHAPPWAIIRMTHVCGEWRRTLCDAQQLWTRWEPIDLTDPKSIKRVKVLAGRAKGGLQELRLTVPYAVNEFGGDMSEVSTALRKTLAEISKTGGRAISSVSMDLAELGHDDKAYEMISRLVTFVEYTSSSIKTFTIFSALARYPSGRPFWTAMPGLQHLVLASLPDGLASSIPFFETKDRPTTCMLRTLHLSGTILRDETFPAFPQMTSLILSRVWAPNLYGLIQSCARTLKYLKLHQVHASSPNGYRRSTAQAQVLDGPPILHLPRLISIESTATSPNLWSMPRPGQAPFLIVAPMLQFADFGSQPFDPLCISRSLGDDSTDNSLSSFAPLEMSQTSISTLLRTSPKIKMLRLGRTILDAEPLLHALRYASDNLETLDVRTLRITYLLDQLHTVIPNLSRLDLAQQYRNHDTVVSLPALARFVDRISQRRPTPSKTPHLHITIDEPTWISEAPTTKFPSLDTLTLKLRTLLSALSPTQLSYLPSSLTLNPFPSSPTHEEVTQQICILASPPASVKAIAEALGLEKGKVVGDDEAVRAAEKGLAAWQERREQEMAMDWLRGHKGVVVTWEKL